MNVRSAEASFDYIVVGAGSSGSVVASRLSEDEATTVLLVEAGPKDASWIIDCPVALESLMTKTRFNWLYSSEAEPKLNGRRVDHPRGRVLGGSSSINGMVYTRGNALDFESWANEQGCAGWGYADVLPYFKKSETFHGQGNKYRGTTGPLLVTRPDVSIEALNRAFMGAGAEAGYPTTPDSNAFQQEGFHSNECTIFDGRRCSASRAYLSDEVRRRPNLSILTDAFVQRILFQCLTACGIQALVDGVETVFRSRKEVILCAGAFGSPQLLQVSGVGPRNILREANVGVLHALEGVGRNLQDHPDLVVQYSCRKPVGVADAARFPGKYFVGLQWLLTKRGLGASNQFEAAAYLRTKAGIKFPNLKLELLRVAMQPDTFKPYPGHSFQLHLTLLRAESRGEVAIASASASDKPRIIFNYLAAAADREAFRSAIRLVREIVAQPAFSDLRDVELAPGSAIKSDDALDAYVASRVATAYHPASTCKMGASDDDAAVVTPDLRVRGLAGLRVADASIMPVVVSSNTNAPTIMIGEKAADLIRGRTLPPEPLPYYVAPAWERSQR